MKIQTDGGIAQPNDTRIKNTKLKKEEQEMKDIINKYDHVFKGIGKIHDTINDNEIYGKFHMKPEVVPVAQNLAKFHTTL